MKINSYVANPNEYIYIYVYIIYMYIYTYIWNGQKTSRFLNITTTQFTNGKYPHRSRYKARRFSDIQFSNCRAARDSNKQSNRE